MGGATTAQVIRELKKIKKNLSKDLVVERMFLFGSRARGEELLTSDVDVIVVSADFSSLSFRQRPDAFLDAWVLPVDLEVLCYTPKELVRKKKEIGLVQEAMRYAQEI